MNRTAWLRWTVPACALAVACEEKKDAPATAPPTETAGAAASAPASSEAPLAKAPEPGGELTPKSLCLEMCGKAQECAEAIAGPMLEQAKRAAEQLGKYGKKALEEANAKIDEAKKEAIADLEQCKTRCNDEKQLEHKSKELTKEDMRKAHACAQKPCQEFLPCMERLAKEQVERRRKAAP